MPETKNQDQQQVTRPALRPFVRPSAAEPALRPIAPVFGRVTLPPFGPIRYGGPKPGAAVIDDEAPSWTSIDEPPLDELAPPAPAEPEPTTSEPTPVMNVAVEPEPAEAEAEELPLPPVSDYMEPEAPAPAWLDTAPPEEAAPEEPEPEPEPEPWEPMTRRLVLPVTGPNDPTPIVNQTIERTTTEPHRMTPMRVTPLRPAPAVPPPYAAPAAEGNARAIAACLEMIAGRVRRGDLVVGGAMPTNDDPPALAAALAATLAAMLGVRN
jgi:hypothetical protein